MNKHKKYYLEMVEGREFSFVIRDGRLIGQPVVSEFASKTPATKFLHLLNGLLRRKEAFLLFPELALPQIGLKPKGKDIYIVSDQLELGEVIAGVASSREVAQRVCDKLAVCTKGDYTIHSGFVFGWYPLTEKERAMFNNLYPLPKDRAVVKSGE